MANKPSHLIRPVTAMRRLASLSWRDLVAVLAPLTVVLVLGTWLAVAFLRPAPPNTIRMIAGPEDSSYRSYANRYKKLIERHGVKVTLLPSRGAVDSLQLLANPGFDADVGFVQGGLTKGVDISRLVSLGSVFVQPLMVYVRGSEKVELLSQLRGKRLAVGPAGSGTRALTLTLLQANDIDGESATLVDLGGDEAAEALVAGQVDAAFLAGDSATNKIQRRLRKAPGIQLMSFRQADGYTRNRRLRFLSKLILPEGASDLAGNYPPRDTQLIGPTVELVARDDLHPAISDLLIKAAQEIHGRAGLFHEAGEFPAPQERDFPISPDAQRYYKSGGKLLYRHLPFWLASLVDRLMVLLVPLLVLIVPAIKVAPRLYDWRVRSRIYRWYGALMAIEREMRTQPSPEQRAEIAQRLDDIQRAVTELRMPVSYAEQLYVLRDHVATVRRRLQPGAEPQAQAS